MPIYLDAIATTPLAPEVRKAMDPFLGSLYGNPSGAHSRALDCRDAIDEARDSVRTLVGAAPDDFVVFTGSGTEANHLAILGLFRSLNRPGRFVCSVGEHPSVMGAARQLEAEGHQVDYVGLEGVGRIRLDEVEAICSGGEVDLIGTHLANYDTGTLQDIGILADIARKHGARFLVDSTTGLSWNPFSLKETGVDITTLAPHRFFGPPGVGAFVFKRGVEMRAVLTGGQQEHGLRPGTHNVPGIIGAGAACALALEKGEDWRKKTSVLQRSFLEKCRLQVPRCHLHGPEPGPHRDPHHLNVAFEYTEGEAVLLNLDLKGVQCTSGTGCVSSADKISPVLTAMGISKQQALASLVLGFLPEHEETDIERSVVHFESAVKRIREMSSEWKNQRESS